MSLKAFWPIEVTVLGNLTVSNLAAPLKVEALIVVKAVVDKSREVMPELKKALIPIEVIRVGNFTSVKLEHPWKTALSIIVIAV